MQSPRNQTGYSWLGPASWLARLGHGRPLCGVQESLSAHQKILPRSHSVAIWAEADLARAKKQYQTPEDVWDKCEASANHGAAPEKLNFEKIKGLKETNSRRRVGRNARRRCFSACCAACCGTECCFSACCDKAFDRSSRAQSLSEKMKHVPFMEVI